MYLLNITKQQLKILLELKDNLTIEHCSVSEKGAIQLYLTDSKQPTLDNTLPLQVELGHISIHKSQGK
jgi:hypothetical protein